MGSAVLECPLKIMALQNHGRRERRRGQRRARRFTTRMWLIMGGIGLGFVALLGVLIASSGGGDGTEGRYPQIGDHWHADYSITICDRTEPRFPDDFATSPDIHTHADGVIHIEPRNPSAAGRNATLARFIAGTGSRLTNESIELPSGVKYTNGDECPDGGTGQMFLRVNGIATLDMASYVPRDGDSLEFGFVVQ